MNVILDTSVVIKWYLKDEEYQLLSDQIFNHLEKEEITLVEPQLIVFELNNIINTACKRGRISYENSLASIKLFSSLGVIFYELADYAESIFKIAFKYKISFYDSTYIFLSKYLDIPFFTADQKLLNLLLADSKDRDEFKNIKHLEEFLLIY